MKCKDCVRLGTEDCYLDNTDEKKEACQRFKHWKE
jgi:hypothetical protein